jgi:hypothetical protein
MAPGRDLVLVRADEAACGSHQHLYCLTCAATRYASAAATVLASPEALPRLTACRAVQKRGRRPDVEGRQAKHTEEISAHFFHAQHSAHDHGIV